MKYNLSALMKAAWRFVKDYGFTMSEALRQAWLNLKLKVRMHVGVVRFWYQKVNGTLREAYGTLSNVPATRGVRSSSSEVQTYFDVQVNDWRCFRRENLIGIE